MSPRQSRKQRDVAIKLADVLSKTLASWLLPGPLGTLVSESIGKGFDEISARFDANQAKLARQIQDIADSITSTALDHHEFFGIAQNDVEAAILAVSDTIATVPIDGKLLRESGYTALGLAEYYRANARDLLRRAGLGEAEYAYVRILESVSHQVVAVLRASPEAHADALADLTDELRSIRQRLNDPGGLYRDAQSAALADYLLTYRLKAGKVLTCSPRRRTSGTTTRSLHTGLAYVDRRLIGPEGPEGLEDMLRRRARILVEADPGHGKTTLLRHTFLRSLAQYDGESRIPVYVDLRGLDEFPDLDASVARVNKWLPKGPSGWVGQLVRDGRALILLDNVEDLFGDADLRMTNEVDLEGFLSEVVGDSVVVMAARRGTFSREWAERHGFVVAELEAPTTDQAFEQIRRWHDAVDAEYEPAEERSRIITRGQELRMALCQVSDLREMSRDPLLCALMCEAFLDSSLSLPQDWIALVQEVLDRLADWDCRPGDPIMSGRTKVRDIQQEIAVWAVHNESPFGVSHLTDAVGQFVAGQDPAKVVDQILSRNSYLKRDSGGLAFVNDHARDHLAAGDLILRGNINYLRGEARQLAKPRLVVAAAGQGRRERATELVLSLLDDAEQYPDVADALIVMAFCGANAALSLEAAVRERALEAAVGLVRRGSTARIVDPTIAPLALDMLVRIIRSREPEPTVVSMAVEVAARIGQSALPVLGAIAQESDSETQEILWNSWSRFEVRPFARTVLSLCTFVPEVVVIDSQEKFSSIAVLPRVHTIEVVCPVDASVMRGRRGLTIRVGDAGLVTSADDLGSESAVAVRGEEVNHGI